MTQIALTTTGTIIKPALCMDLDGTIRYSKNGKFINKPDDIALFEGVEEKLWEYRNNGWLILGLSNQGGVAYGIKTPAEEQREIDVTLQLFGQDPFHDIKTCWFHSAGKLHPFNKRSLLRKPDIGMLVHLEISMFNRGIMIDWNNSLMVGDRSEDAQCAENAAINFQWAHEFFGREKAE